MFTMKSLTRQSFCFPRDPWFDQHGSGSEGRRKRLNVEMHFIYSCNPVNIYNMLSHQMDVKLWLNLLLLECSPMKAISHQ